MSNEESALSDAQLVDQAAAGNEAAFSVLFDRFFDRIHGYAYRIVLDHQAAADVAQESFIKVARQIGGLRDSRAFEGWLYRICGNLARDHLRSAKTYAANLEAAAQEQPARADSASEAAERAHHLMARLPADQREAVALVYLEGYSHAEAAQRAGCAESTISWRILLAKRALRKFLPS